MFSIGELPRCIPYSQRVLFQCQLIVLPVAPQVFGTTGGTAAGVVSVFAAGGVAVMSSGSMVASGLSSGGGSGSTVGVLCLGVIPVRKIFSPLCLVCAGGGGAASCTVQSDKTA